MTEEQKELENYVFGGFNKLMNAASKVMMILPAIFIGILCGIGALFEVFLQKSLETYNMNEKKKGRK